MTRHSRPWCHVRHPHNRKLWCDRDGLGGFMGHICKPLLHAELESFRQPLGQNHPAAQQALKEGL